MFVRETTDADLEDILLVLHEAFTNPKEASLVNDILKDPTAKPLVSLLAFVDNQVAGHILFSNAKVSNNPEKLRFSILAPLAVKPQFQKQGVGEALIKKGLKILSDSGVDVVFVLGHPTYYPKHGFTPAGTFGFVAPYPVPEKDVGAWMVQALRSEVIGCASGTVTCCDALNKPEHWRE
ncbi:MAG: N-acetyltransferase [Candidatus Bathyarchaeota archaeon]|nr:N-acetyltransferase [Candidatus Bathyarchaeum sp.]